jgi:ABC-type multidrug transport system ATPase subunit
MLRKSVAFYPEENDTTERNSVYEFLAFLCRMRALHYGVL